MAKKSRSSSTAVGGADDPTARLPPSGSNKPKSEALLSEDQPTAMIDLAAFAASEFGDDALKKVTRAMDTLSAPPSAPPRRVMTTPHARWMRCHSGCQRRRLNPTNLKSF